MGKAKLFTCIHEFFKDSITSACAISGLLRASSSSSLGVQELQHHSRSGEEQVELDSGEAPGHQAWRKRWPAARVGP